MSATSVVATSPRKTVGTTPVGAKLQIVTLRGLTAISNPHAREHVGVWRLNQTSIILLEEAEGSSGRTVSLGEHGGTGLNQGIPSRELRGFLRYVHIGDAAISGF